MQTMVRKLVDCDWLYCLRGNDSQYTEQHVTEAQLRHRNNDSVSYCSLRQINCTNWVGSHLLLSWWTGLWHITMALVCLPLQEFWFMNIVAQWLYSSQPLKQYNSPHYLGSYVQTQGRVIINCIYNAPVTVLKTSSKHSTASHITHNT